VDLPQPRFADRRHLPEKFGALRVDLRDEDDRLQKAFTPFQARSCGGDGWEVTARRLVLNCANMIRFREKHDFCL
jgi:hypothetical protein